MGRNNRLCCGISRRGEWRLASRCRSGRRQQKRIRPIRPIRMGTMSNFKVLIVDDERLSRRRIRRLLTLEPECEVIGECANGVEAVNALSRTRPDILFLDVQMPELDGFEV